MVKYGSVGAVGSGGRAGSRYLLRREWEAGAEGEEHKCRLGFHWLPRYSLSSVGSTTSCRPGRGVSGQCWVGVVGEEPRGIVM